MGLRGLFGCGGHRAVGALDAMLNDAAMALVILLERARMFPASSEREVWSSAARSTEACECRIDRTRAAMAESSSSRRPSGRGRTRCTQEPGTRFKALRSRALSEALPKQKRTTQAECRTPHLWDNRICRARDLHEGVEWSKPTLKDGCRRLRHAQLKHRVRGCPPRDGRAPLDGLRVNHKLERRVVGGEVAINHRRGSWGTPSRD